MQFPHPFRPTIFFANRIHLTGSATNVTANNIRASKEVGEPNLPMNNGGHSLWWSWTAPANGMLQVDTVGSTFDTILGIFTNSVLTHLAPIASNDDGGPGSTSRIWTDVTAGTVYQIVVDGFSSTSPIGDVALNLAFTPFPSNDNFANRTPIVGTFKVVTESNILATKELNEPNHADMVGGSSLWWTWTAPLTGPVTISTFGSTVSHGVTLDTALAVYTGTNMTNLTVVATNDNFTYIESQVSFTATKGVSYQITRGQPERRDWKYHPEPVAGSSDPTTNSPIGRL